MNKEREKYTGSECSPNNQLVEYAGEVFEELGLQQMTKREFKKSELPKMFKKPSILQYDGIIYSTSSSCKPDKF